MTKLFLAFALFALLLDVRATNILGYNDAKVRHRNLKKKISKKDNDPCAAGTCVRNFAEFEAALGKKKSSADIYICAGETISFEKTLYIYSEAIKPQNPFALQLLCCDCNCVLDASGVNDPFADSAFWFGAKDQPFPTLSSMKLTMNGITVQNAPQARSFFSYLKENSEYEEVGSCPNTVDLSTVRSPFFGYGESTAVEKAGTPSNRHVNAKNTNPYKGSVDVSDLCAAGTCVSNFEEFAAALGQDKSAAEIHICAGATISFERTLHAYSTTVTGRAPFELQLLCCDCNCVLDAGGVVAGLGDAIRFEWSGLKLSMNGIRLQNAPFAETNFFVYLAENSVYKAVGNCPNTIDLAKMVSPFLGVIQEQ